MYPFTITTLGCKVNQYDAQTISELLIAEGFTPAKKGQNPSLIVVTTCCVTTTAMRKTRQTIRKNVRNAPNATVWVLGCYADYDKEKILDLLAELGVPEKKSLVAGHHDEILHAANAFINANSGDSQPAPATTLNKTPDDEKSCAATSENGEKNPGTPTAPSVPQNIKKRRQDALRKKPNVTKIPSIGRFAGHQRAFVKVQDGCDAFCSYCIVPFTRGRVWSKSIEHVETECAELIAAGHREIVLCGVFLGAFGRTPQTTIRKNWNDCEKPGKLPELVRRVAALPGLWKVRLSSLEPGDMTDELLKVAANCPTVAPHFHLPLQSGSNRILHKMNRQYAAEEFVETAAKLRQILDNPAITTDIIVGFPEETDEDFAETLKMAKIVKFTKIHAFPFSAIEPTAAWTRRELAPAKEVTKNRLAQLAKIEQQSAVEYRKLFLGEQMEVLVEGGGAKKAEKGAETLAHGMTDRYLTVEFPLPPAAKHADYTGKVVNVHINAATDTELTGHIL
ncbi:MAG: MiaB/RimO family radical SAM methylthiotransferase [Phycisphaerae bacterium]|nr:MiaB/RimO family radical SAM methylthiotransferase [Phycisphaerae bacterium]